MFVFHHFKGPPVESMNVMAMEKLPINNNGGQGYGFILYQTTLKRLPKQITIQHVYDRAQVLSTHALQGSIWDLSFGGEVLPSAMSFLVGYPEIFVNEYELRCNLVHFETQFWEM